MKKLCIKCGADDHTNRNCSGPVTSYGLIVFYENDRENCPNVKKGRIYDVENTKCVHHKEIIDDLTYNDNLLFLLVERRDTISFLNLIQGSYPDIEPFRSEKIDKYISELTCSERDKLRNESFSNLWKIAGSERRDYEKALLKFEKLSVKTLLDSTTCYFREADYLMSKGRLKYGETKRQCAIREFAEETGYRRNHVELLNIPSFEETFVGTDGKMYKNVFYVARLKKDAKIDIPLDDIPEQCKEVRNIGWFSLQECMNLMRDSQQGKKDILSATWKILSNYPYV